MPIDPKDPWLPIIHGIDPVGAQADSMMREYAGVNADLDKNTIDDMRAQLRGVLAVKGAAAAHEMTAMGVEPGAQWANESGEEYLARNSEVIQAIQRAASSPDAPAYAIAYGITPGMPMEDVLERLSLLAIAGMAARYVAYQHATGRAEMDSDSTREEAMALKFSREAYLSLGDQQAANDTLELIVALSSEDYDRSQIAGAKLYWTSGLASKLGAGPGELVERLHGLVQPLADTNDGSEVQERLHAMYEGSKMAQDHYLVHPEVLTEVANAIGPEMPVISKLASALGNASLPQAIRNVAHDLSAALDPEFGDPDAWSGGQGSWVQKEKWFGDLMADFENLHRTAEDELNMSPNWRWSWGEAFTLRAPETPATRWAKNMGAHWEGTVRPLKQNVMSAPISFISAFGKGLAANLARGLGADTDEQDRLRSEARRDLAGPFMPFVTGRRPSVLAGDFSKPYIRQLGRAIGNQKMSMQPENYAHYVDAYGVGLPASALMFKAPGAANGTAGLRDPRLLTEAVRAPMVAPLSPGDLQFMGMSRITGRALGASRVLPGLRGKFGNWAVGQLDEPARLGVPIGIMEARSLQAAEGPEVHPEQ